MRSLVIGLAAAIALAACDGSPAEDAGARDDAGRADGGADASASARDAAVPLDDAGPPPEGIPTLVAIGKFGRITTSCDGGETWPHDRSDDDGASCVGIDCDHHRGSATGLTWGGGFFWATFGWGEPAMRVMRSRDGVTWETVYDSADLHFAGVAWTGDRLIGATTQPHWSIDGATWEAAEWPEWDVPEGEWPVARQVGFAPVGGGRVAVVASQGDWGAIVLSQDDGATFAPVLVDAACHGASRPPVFGGGAWVLPWSFEGVVCASTDGGETWTASVLAAGSPLSNSVFTGAEHVLYAADRRFSSADGRAWDEARADASIGVLAYDPTRSVYAGVVHDRHYEAQRFLRSSDGLAWDELAEGAHVRGHPITHMVFGWGAIDGACAP